MQCKPQLLPGCHTGSTVTVTVNLIEVGLLAILHANNLYLLAAMDAFKGKFERTSADNYEELLKVICILCFCVFVSLSHFAQVSAIMSVGKQCVSARTCHTDKDLEYHVLIL